MPFSQNILLVDDAITHYVSLFVGFSPVVWSYILHGCFPHSSPTVVLVHHIPSANFVPTGPLHLENIGRGRKDTKIRIIGNIMREEGKPINIIV